MTDRATIGRRNKARGKVYERDVARILGTSRMPADTGGAEDLMELDGMHIQVKSGMTVVTEIMRTALVSARTAAAFGGLPTVVLVDRRGTRNQRWICFPLEEWAAWNGYPRVQYEAKGPPFARITLGPSEKMGNGGTE